MDSTTIRSRLGNRFRSAYSLRSRYLVITLLVTLVIVAGTLVAHSYISRTSEIHSRNIQLRYEASVQIRLLRNAILDVERSVNAYLLQPDKLRREHINDALSQALAHQQRLYDLEWFKDTNMAQELDDFGLDLLKGFATAISKRVIRGPERIADSKE